MHSVMAHNFSQVPAAEIPRSSFDRSHGYKTTLDAGYLVPVFIDEALPGDTFNLRMNVFARLATPIVPVMDNLFMDSFFFAVPIRLLWDNWQRFNGEQSAPGDSTDYIVPHVSAPAGGTGWTVGTLGDYFGIPTQVPNTTPAAFFFRAYNLIWNEWFRDQNLQDPVPVHKDDGPDPAADYVLLRRGKRHDYFTSCLPWPQKGPAVELPLGTSAPVIPNGNQPQFATAGTLTNFGSVIYDGLGLDLGAPSGGSIPAASPLQFKESGLYADLSAATAATINSLRQAFQIQKLFERDARGGTRYTEIIRAHFGVVSPDARLQRPEYLGGGSQPININPVAQTSSSDTTTPQANLAAFGTVGISGHGFVKSFTEHCVVIGFVSVRADLNYQQGLNRMWSRKTRFDFYWPALSHLGEQEVLNKEIYFEGTSDDDLVFGYQERYAEYRYKPSLITGQFRSTFAQTLDIWHLAQDFTGSRPHLNADFIQDNPPIDRVIAVPSYPHFLFDSYFNYKCARPMPVYSVPGLIDHF